MAFPVINGLHVPVAQPKASGDALPPAAAEGGDFDALMSLLSSLMPQQGENPDVDGEWLQQQVEAAAENLPEGLDESAMAEITAWIDGLISQQEAGAGRVDPDINLLSSLSVSPTGQPLATTTVSQPVAVNSGEAARVALNQLPDMGALYSGSVHSGSAKKTENDNGPADLQLIKGLDEPLSRDPNKAVLPERMEAVRTPGVIESSFLSGSLSASSVISDSGTPVSPSGQAAMLSVSMPAADGRLAATTQTLSATTPANQLPLQMVGDEGEWSNALGQRLMTLVGDKVKEATIRLDPPELGQLGIKVVVEDDHLKIRFAAALPQVREMLEGQADRLRAAFDGSSFARVDIDVRQQAGDREGRQQAGGFAEFVDNSVDEAAVESAQEVVMMPKKTTLDVFV